MRRTEVAVVGGGQAGLAMSRSLTDRKLDHVVLERGRVAERWRSERWDSLRLLTPNWHSRLPGWAYRGPDPDGYMTMAEVVAHLEGYARSFPVPLEEGTAVLSVEPTAPDGYRLVTSRGDWQVRSVVVATGYCDVPFVPPAAQNLPADVVQVVPSRYRNPKTLPAGGVLVVGASSTGVQLADEIQASGRPVTLAVGRHTRLPRLHRGRDILWWLAAMGVLQEHIGAVADAEASRRQPSLQLVGHEDRATLDLRILEARGVRLAGRLRDARGGEVFFDDDLVASTAAADVKLAKLLARIERFAADQGLSSPGDPEEPFEPFLWPREAPRRLDLAQEGIRSVVWATGFKRRYPWLRVPVLDPAGEIRHREGVTEAPGLYVLGLQFQRRRHSAFIGGVGDDALFLAEHIARRARGEKAAA